MKGNVLQSVLVYAVRRGGTPALLGLLSLVVAAFFLGLELMPAQTSLAQLKLKREVVQAEQGKAREVVLLTPAQQLAAFYRDFPADKIIPDVLSQIYKLAHDQQLPLELGEYAMTKLPGTRLDQFRITLPIKGSYLQVRKFVAEVLQAQPALSLQSLTLRREKIAQEGVDARVVLVLFMEHAP
jgi:Tfp pilus assembly protein PilO